MPHGNIVKRLRQVDTVPNRLRRPDFSGTAYSSGSGEATILDYRADQPIALRHGERYEAAVVAHESFTTNATAGDTETFNLANDLINSDVTDPDLLLYDDGTQVDPAAVNYSGDSFDYTDSGTGSTLDVYYVIANQAAVKLKKVAPGGSTSETLIETNTGRQNRRDQSRDPPRVDVSMSPLQGVIPSDWTLEWTLDASFSTQFSPEPINFIISLPIRRARVPEIEGLGAAVAQDAAKRP